MGIHYYYKNDNNVKGIHYYYFYTRNVKAPPYVTRNVKGIHNYYYYYCIMASFISADCKHTSPEKRLMLSAFSLRRMVS